MRFLQLLLFYVLFFFQALLLFQQPSIHLLQNLLRPQFFQQHLKQLLQQRLPTLPFLLRVQHQTFFQQLFELVLLLGPYLFEIRPHLQLSFVHLLKVFLFALLEHLHHQMPPQLDAILHLLALKLPAIASQILALNLNYLYLLNLYQLLLYQSIHIYKHIYLVAYKE